MREMRVDDEEMVGWEYVDETPSARFSKWDLVVAACSVLQGVAESFAVGAGTIRHAAMAASNKECLDTVFHEEAAREIEKLIEGDEE